MSPDELIAEIQERGLNLTPWEEGFIAEMEELRLRDGALSHGQEAKLRQIYDERVLGMSSPRRNWRQRG